MPPAAPPFEDTNQHNKIVPNVTGKDNPEVEGYLRTLIKLTK